jgi:RHS repeat-associated protein
LFPVFFLKPGYFQDTLLGVFVQLHICFTSQEYDTETGLYNYRARLYDGETGRFLSVDPKAHLFPGWSPYAGMLNNPISNIDPDGQEPVTLTVLAVAAVVGGGLNMWSNKDKIKDWRSGLAYFATGAVGGGASLFNPAIGGAITSVGNVLVDAATGNLPDWDNPWEVGA